MNIEQLLEELRKTLQVNGVSHTILLHLLERCRIALSEQADLLRRAEMSVENCDRVAFSELRPNVMYREREASVPDALRATPVAQDEVSKLREREAFNSGYEAICRRSITNREIASRMFQAGAEWQRSQQSAPAVTRDMVQHALAAFSPHVPPMKAMHAALTAAIAAAPKADVQVYQCPHCATSMEVDPTAKAYKAPKADVQEPVKKWKCRHSEGEKWFISDHPGYWECIPIEAAPPQSAMM